jgi:hypothetical protein
MEITKVNIMQKKLLSSVIKAALSILPLAGFAHANTPSEVNISDWDLATLEDTTAAYSRYIVNNPQSLKVEEARTRIEALSSDDQLAYWTGVSDVFDELEIQDGVRRELDAGFGTFIDV